MKLNLTIGKGFGMRPWNFGFQGREKIGVILERQPAVQPTDDVQLRRAFGDGFAGDLNSLFDRMRVGTLLSSTLVKAAKFAVGDADIRMVEVAVDIVIRRQPVLFSPDVIGQFTERVKVACRVKRHTIVERQTFAAYDLVGDVSQIHVKRKLHTITPRSLCSRFWSAASVFVARPRRDPLNGTQWPPESTASLLLLFRRPQHSREGREHMLRNLFHPFQ